MLHSFGYSFIGGYLGYRWDFKKPSFSSQQANPQSTANPATVAGTAMYMPTAPCGWGGMGGCISGVLAQDNLMPTKQSAIHTPAVSPSLSLELNPCCPHGKVNRAPGAIPQLLRPHSQPRAPQPPALSIPAARRSGTATPFPSPPSIRAIPPHFCLLANHAAAPSVLPAGKYLLPVGLRQRVPSNQVSAGLSSQAGAGAQLSSVPPAHTLLGVFVARRGCRCRLQARTSR